MEVKDVTMTGFEAKIGERLWLAEVTKRLMYCLDLKEFRYRLVKYEKCFIGSQAIDALIGEGMALDENHALTIMNSLVHLRIVIQPHQSSKIFDPASHYTFRYIMALMLKQRKGRDSVEEQMNDMNMSISEMGYWLFQRVKPETIQVNNLTYRNCFHGKIALITMVTEGMSWNRMHAVEISSKMVELKTVIHVSEDPNVVSFDTEFDLFRFRMQSLPLSEEALSAPVSEGLVGLTKKISTFQNPRHWKTTGTVQATLCGVDPCRVRAFIERNYSPSENFSSSDLITKLLSEGIINSREMGLRIVNAVRMRGDITLPRWDDDTIGFAPVNDSPNTMCRLSQENVVDIDDEKKL